MFALTPSPSPTMWERGEPSADMFGVLKRQLQHQAEAALPHSIITAWARGVGAHGGAPCGAFPLARLRERGTKGVRAKTRVYLTAMAQIGIISKRACRVQLARC